MEKVDVDKLERELVNAWRADRRYSRENDAKFRAVNQKVQSYEEFRDIVKASHLAPLDRKDIIDPTRNQPWNAVAHGASKTAETEESASPVSSFTTDRVSNVQEFTREWRKLCREPKLNQYQFLLRVGGACLYNIFKVEISMGLLGEFLLTLNEAFQGSDSGEVVNILDQLAKTSRFSLSIKFLSKRERQAAGELFKKLIHFGSDENELTTADTIRELAKHYEVQDLT